MIEFKVVKDRKDVRVEQGQDVEVGVGWAERGWKSLEGPELAGLRGGEMVLSLLVEFINKIHRCVEGGVNRKFSAFGSGNKAKVRIWDGF